VEKKQNNPIMNDLESKIVFKLKNIPNFRGLDKLKKIQNIQLDYLASTIVQSNDNYFDEFQSSVKSIFSVTSLTIVNNPTQEIKSGLILISNHLGINKLTKLTHQKIETRIKETTGLNLNVPPLENNDPFILLFAPIVEALTKSAMNFNDIELIFVCMKFAPVYSKILLNINSVLLQRWEGDQYAYLHKSASIKIKSALNKQKIPVFVIFPEGGTTGKYNESEPYQLLNFKNGYLRLANDFDLNILPLAISVDSDLNYFANFGDFLSKDDGFEGHRKILQKMIVL
jgi:hypothetical protein